MNYFSRLPQEIILTYILPRLDGETLIALSSVSSEFFHLICKNNNENLWRNICISKWPSLLSYRPIVLSTMISMFPGGYRSFFSDAFPSIHHRNTTTPPPLPPNVNFTYAVDIFLQGEQEQEREPLYAKIQYQEINIKKTYPSRCLRDISSTVASDVYFKLNMVNSNLNFIPVKKDGCEKYLKEKLKLSCVLISSRHDPKFIKMCAWGMFSSSCKPVISVTKRRVVAVYKTVMPGLCKYYTEMVKFKVKVKCGWEDGEEDRFYVRCIEFRMEDMNGKHLKEEDAAKVLLNAIKNGERKKK